MRTMNLGAVVLAGALVVAPAVSASAADTASPISKAFTANVSANLDFLADVARLGVDRASPGLRDFARAEAHDVTTTRVALDTARPPQDAHLAAADTDALMTGRSVAIDGPVGGPAKAANGRAPLGAADIEALSKLSGKALDDALWFKQVDALSQLRADYRAYADDGDDPALAKLAEAELPKVEARLLALSKL